MRALPILILVGCGAGGGGGGADAPIDCSSVTADVDGSPVDTFVVGLEKMGTAGAVDFKLMSASPAPPSRGDNTWILQINSMTSGVVGSPLTGASISVTPYMLAHGHGTPKTVAITAMSTPGQYQLAPVNTWMPGVWMTTIQVAAPANDKAVYRFCIPN